MTWSWFGFAIAACCFLPGIVSTVMEAWRRRSEGGEACCKATCKSCALGVVHTIVPLGPARSCVRLIWKHAHQ
eukprot:gene4779-60340_t